MKKFCTMYVFAGDEHIAKDVGQIPYELSKQYGYESTLAGAFFSDSQQRKIEHMKLDKIKLIKRSFGLTGGRYILKNAKKIDILNLYHTNRRVWVHAKLYKLLNPKGKLYIKLDCGLETCDIIDTDKQYRSYFIKCLKIADLITVESEVAKERLKKYDTTAKIKIIPNGFGTEGYERPKAKEKEKIILSVGNLSHYPKGTDDLVRAFYKSRCYERGWKLILAGRMDEEFRTFYKDYLAEHRELKDNIIYKGFIMERAEINKLYREANIFALPSYNENFSLAACEALANGCYLILSDRVSPFKELTGNGRYGIVVGTGKVDELAEVISHSTDSYTTNLVKETVEYAISNFSWENIIPRIQRELNKFI